MWSKVEFSLCPPGLQLSFPLSPCQPLLVNLPRTLEEVWSLVSRRQQAFLLWQPRLAVLAKEAQERLNFPLLLNRFKSTNFIKKY